MYTNILALCQQIVIEAKQEDFHVGVDKSFIDYSDLVLDIVNDWPKEKKEHPNLPLFLRKLGELRDDFEREVALDPIVLYKPRCAEILRFLSSPAKIRYLHSGNRFGKSAAGMIDNAYLLTDTHPYRPTPKYPSSVIAIGPDYTNYAAMVFEPKYIDGEPDSALTPIFPEGGRWKHSYNRVTKTLRLGCKACASRLRSRDCPHPKPALYLCSDQGKPTAIAGGQHGKLSMDEDVSEPFYIEGMERLKATLGSYCDVHMTPVHGSAWWTYEKLKVLNDDPEYKNEYYHPLLRQRVKYIDVFSGSQYEGGLVPHSEIDAYIKAKEREPGGYELIRQRIYGEHVSLATSKVFDQEVVRQQKANARNPYRGNLAAKGEAPDVIRQILRDTQQADLIWEPEQTGPYHVWEEPDREGQYIIGADVAQGLAGGDLSIAHVYRMRPLAGRLHLEHVAKYRGHINPIPYAYVLFKLSLWYNSALVVPERNGPGHTVIHELVKEVYHMEVFLGQGRLSNISENVEPAYGVTVSADIKPGIIGVAKHAWRDKDQSLVTTYDLGFLYEMEHYVQEPSKTGHMFKYHGEGNCHDDEVTAFMMAAYASRVDEGVYQYDNTKEEVDKYAHMNPHQAEFWRYVHRKQAEMDEQGDLEW